MNYQYCQVRENEALSDSAFRLTIYAPWLCQEARPGQFIMLGLDSSVYLNRPFGIAGIDRRSDTFSLLIKQLGEGTAQLSRIQKDRELPVLGPLGNGFPLPEALGKSLLVAGGMGIAPLLCLAQSLHLQGLDFAVIYGEKSEKYLLAASELQALDRQVYYITEDGSKGYTGFPTALLPELLEKGVYRRLYVCGPMPMMRAVAAVAQQYGVTCYVSMEERMGCGYGVCMGCVCKIKQTPPLAGLEPTLKHSRICKEGPVFLAQEVEWDG